MDKELKTDSKQSGLTQSSASSPASSPASNRSINTAFNSLTLCLVEVPWWLATLALVFFGPLLAFYGYAAILLIAGSIVAMTITAYFSSWRGIIWIPQGVPTAILAITTVAIISNAPTGTSTTDLFVTVVALIAVSSITTGTLFYALGKFRLGNLVRYLPFPVMAGFLGGTGWLLLKAGIDISIGDQFTGSYWQPEIIQRWSPALLLALATWSLGRRYDHPLLLPGLMLFSTIAFHLLLLTTELSLDSMNASGWMFSALTPDTQPGTLALSDLARIDWLVIWEHSGSILVLAVASVIAMLLHSSGFELQIGKDSDINRDLRVAGLANILGGLVGGWPGYMSPAASIINARQGQQLPASGLLVSVGVALIIWLAMPLISRVPLFVIGSAVSFLGVNFIADWVFTSFKRMTSWEYLVVLCIVAAIALFGLPHGVIVGLLLTVALFLVTFSRVDVIRHQLTGEHSRSRVKRNMTERAHLQANGASVQIFQLQGYLFFGTANSLLESIRATTSRSVPQFVVLDFERVSGVDSTAVSSFRKLQKDADNNNWQLVFAGLNATSLTTVEQQFQSTNAELPQCFNNIDAALEWTEQKQLLHAGLRDNTTAATLKEYLQSISPDANNIEEILQKLEKIELQAGDYLIHQGDLATEMFFIEKGSITAQIEHPAGTTVRLESMGYGVVGELAFYLSNKRAAAVICNTDVSAFKLSRKTLDQLEQQHPKEASTIHLILAKLLSERTSHLVALVSALQK